ncbi:MAG: hypothetical protein IJK59_07595 [Firmicutes bacterium]|nr:hypothetical protein [Bacillota bacterium]MBQ6261095.1 hypothetical protein [Bacillota bacterium]MBR0442481.1 hypothetical protein [Bacillota bacterium]
MNKKTKKRIVGLALVFALFAVIASGTLAYFTDTDEATNVFTAGNIDIQLDEWGKDAEGTFVEFAEDTALKELAPGSSSTTEVMKVATITNTGDSDAWVWAEILVPSKLVSANAPTNESNSALHYNTYGAYATEYFGRYTQTPINDGVQVGNAISVDPNAEYVDIAEENTWSNPVKGGDNVTIDDVEYVVMLTKMKSPLPVGKTSLPFLRGVYMDNDVDVARDAEGKIIEDTYVIPVQGTDNKVTWEDYDGSWEVLVRVYGIQVPGFDNVDDAYNAYIASFNADGERVAH